MAPYTRISGDSHLEVANERWTHRIDPKFRDRAPKTVKLETGADASQLEDLPPAQNPMDLYGGKGRDIWYPGGQTYELTPGTGSSQQRVQEQDKDGLDAEILYPAVVVGPRLWMKAQDEDLQRAIFRGWNAWVGEEYCAEAPDRLAQLMHKALDAKYRAGIRASQQAQCVADLEEFWSDALAKGDIPGPTGR